ncbi:MAG: SMP-30/gluconolactonase/LRE family protein [Pseudomonadota bacterium]
MPQPQVISTSRDKVGECPVWDVSGQALYWVDIEGRHIRRWNWAATGEQTWDLPERVGCIALSSRGTVIAAMESGVFEVTLGVAPSVTLRLIAAITHREPNMRFNDGRCDASGRFWLTTMQMDMSKGSDVGSLYCLDENGLSPAKLSGLLTPNGSAFSPDGKTFYLSDSHPRVQKIWAFDFDAQTAGLSGRRLFLDMTSLPGRPDGAAVDNAGHYWICGNDAGQIHKVNPQGSVVSSLEVPVPKPSMCAFGGPDMDVLFVASIPPADAAGNSLDGAMLAFQCKEKGMPEPRFSRFPVASG